MSAEFEYIDARKAEFPIVKMCEWAEVSTSGYYEWRGRPASATAIRREHYTVLVKAVFEHSGQTNGYRRVYAQLVRQGEQVSPELLRELMRDLSWSPASPDPIGRRTTVPGDPGPIPDLVNRDFTAQAPGQKWSPISPIPTWHGWVYLAAVIDCYAKACIGYAMAGHLRAELSDGPFNERIGYTLKSHENGPSGMYHTTEFSTERIVDLCAMIHKEMAG